MKKFLFLLLSFFFLAPFVSPKPAYAQTAPTEFAVAQVTEIVEEGVNELSPEFKQPFQKLKIKLWSGKDRGQVLDITHGDLFTLQESQMVKKGDFVVVTKTPDEAYYIADRFRVPTVAIVAVVLVAMVLVVSRLKAVGFLVAILASLAVVAKFIIPQILANKNPFLITAVGLTLIIFLIVYLGYGISRKGNLAIVASVITVLISLGITNVLMNLVGITGAGTEEAVYLQTEVVDVAGLRSLIFAGILAGTAGIVTHLAVDSMAILEKSSRGKSTFIKNLMAIKEELPEHLVVLTLLYVGASLPIFILFNISKTIPFWVTLNSEFVTEEVVRLLIGMLSVVLVLPVTALVAKLVPNKKV